jgi:hypothetical protein
LRVLFSPLGLAQGSLFTAIVLLRPDHVVVVTSAEAAGNLAGAVEGARAHHPSFTVEQWLLADPFAGFLEGRRLARRLAQKWGCRRDCEFIVNLTGGTTVMQDALKQLAQLLGAREVAVVDRRPPEAQRRKPLVIGELVELPPADVGEEGPAEI